MIIHHTVKNSRCSFTATYKTPSDMVNFVIGYSKVFCFVLFSKELIDAHVLKWGI